MQDTLTALREYQDSNYKGIYSEKVHSNYFEGAAFLPSRTGPNLECEVEKFVTGLICNLQKRLTPGTDIVLQATNVANLIAWPENDSGIAAIRSFGNDEMTTVVEHYKEQLMFPSDEILEEWLTLKSILYRRYGKDIQNTRWQDINKALRPLGTVDKVLRVIDLILSIPATSSANERDFSVMSLIKTNRKSWLKNKTLSDLMVINRETPSIKEYNPTDDVNLWISSGMRKPRRKEKKC